jgi:hypothetical protein
VNSEEFSAKRVRNCQSGTLDWGPITPNTTPRSSADLGNAQSRTVAQLRRLGTSLGVRDEDRLAFDHVPNLDVTIQMARRVRSALQVPTPAPRSHRSRQHPPRPLGFLDCRVAGVINATVLTIGTVAFVIGASLFKRSLRAQRRSRPRRCSCCSLSHFPYTFGPSGFRLGELRVPGCGGQALGDCHSRTCPDGR